MPPQGDREHGEVHLGNRAPGRTVTTVVGRMVMAIGRMGATVLRDGIDTGTKNLIRERAWGRLGH